MLYNNQVIENNYNHPHPCGSVLNKFLTYRMFPKISMAYLAKIHCTDYIMAIIPICNFLLDMYLIDETYVLGSIYLVVNMSNINVI